MHQDHHRRPRLGRRGDLPHVSLGILEPRPLGHQGPQQQLVGIAHRRRAGFALPSGDLPGISPGGLAPVSAGRCRPGFRQSIQRPYMPEQVQRAESSNHGNRGRGECHPMARAEGKELVLKKHHQGSQHPRRHGDNSNNRDLFDR